MQHSNNKFSFFFITILCCLLTACATNFWSVASKQKVSPIAASPINDVQKVTLLLPLQGSLGASGQAIRNGFLAAYYQAQQEGKKVPAINVVDTSNSNVVNLYQKTVDSGANFVIGPLTKPEVQALADHGNLTVPTLALNTLDSSKTARNLYQFGLYPRDEAQQVAEKAWNEGLRRVIIISAAAPWAQTITNAFTQQWQHLGGQIVASTAFSSSQDIESAVTQALEISPQEARNKASQTVLQHRISALADMIFIVALPQQARQIQPFLKFYYAASLPIYATSTIYSGTPAPALDQDLNGIHFCDMPWVLKDSTQLPSNLATIHERIMTLWPSGFAHYPKLFALGIDAYTAMSQFNQLIVNPKANLVGATGTLYLTTDGHLHRYLTWSVMRDGIPFVPTPSINM